MGAVASITAVVTLKFKWTTPKDLRGQVRRLWDRGVVLREIVAPAGVFPKRLVLKRPGSVELRDRFGDVRAWAASLRSVPHVRIVMREVRHRVIGTNALPHAAWVESADEAAALIGKRRELKLFRELVAMVGKRQPALVPWLAKRPIRALEIGSRWNGLLSVVKWLQDRPRPNIYVRQMDVAGVDTKFVEAHRRTLAELLDITLPPEAIDHAMTGAAKFADRYGFRSKPQHVRIRILDPELALLPWRGEEAGQDVVLSAASFANLETSARRIIVTENEINFLALPLMEGTLAVFGAGYGVEALGGAGWLERCRVHYWGDIDTHGFAILDELRDHLEKTESFLMDRHTFQTFEPLRVPERKPATRTLTRLTSEEQELYADLCGGKYDPNSRLEQERISFGWVEAALARLPGPQ